MTGKDFMNRVANGEMDILQIVLTILADTGADYCIIGGLAVNAYTEPVISLDLDIVVIAEKLAEVYKEAKAKGLKVKQFEHSVNLTSKKSDLRIQIQTDMHYQDFLQHAELKEVLGYEMKVAAVEDVLKGKIWAYGDRERRKSKRQKDLADIMRLLESHPALEKIIPTEISENLSKL